MTPWTADIVERFNVLLAERPVLPYKEIARQLSELNGWYFTKNACIGYARRNGVPPRTPPRASRKGIPLKPRARPRKPKLRLAPRLRREKPKRIGRVLIEQLGPKDCRWPFGTRAPYFFCGQTQIEGSSYCYTHTCVSCPSFARGQ